jgi:hypothetical protein
LPQHLFEIVSFFPSLHAPAPSGSLFFASAFSFFTAQTSQEYFEMSNCKAPDS